MNGHHARLGNIFSAPIHKYAILPSKGRRVTSCPWYLYFEVSQNKLTFSKSQTDKFRYLNLCRD